MALVLSRNNFEISGVCFADLVSIFYRISKIFIFDDAPRERDTLDLGTSKYSARALTTASLARPSVGGAFTLIVNSRSEVFSTDSILEFGLTLTDILTGMSLPLIQSPHYLFQEIPMVLFFLY